MWCSETIDSVRKTVPNPKRSRIIRLLNKMQTNASKHIFTDQNHVDTIRHQLTVNSPSIKAAWWKANKMDIDTQHTELISTMQQLLSRLLFNTRIFPVTMAQAGSQRAVQKVFKHRWCNRPDSSPVAQPTVSNQWRHKIIHQHWYGDSLYCTSLPIFCCSLLNSYSFFSSDRASISLFDICTHRRLVISNSQPLLVVLRVVNS